MQIRIIKKYPNRRLYDSKIGAYITLEDIKKLVCERVNFQVIDARNKKDLTQNILLQIISEQEINNPPIFSNSTLQELIRLYHEKSQDILRHYLDQMVNLFIQQKDFFEKQWQNFPIALFDSNMLKTMLQMQKKWFQTQIPSKVDEKSI